MLLLDLPSELLTLIVQHLGGPILRTSATNLSVSKRWYLVALPVYLSSLDLTNVYLSSWDLGRLPPVHSSLGSLIQANVRQLSLRLVGHPSRRTAIKPWILNDGAHVQGRVEEIDDWMTVGPRNYYGINGDGVKHTEDCMSGTHPEDCSEDCSRDSLTKKCPHDCDCPEVRYSWEDEMQHQLLAWRKIVNTQLDSFATFLFSCTALDEFGLEISSENNASLGPCWDYIYDSSLKSILSSLPKGLTRLTFDTCGSRTISCDGDDATPIHLCPLLARRLRDLQHVRLRMRCICPEVLELHRAEDTAASRLEYMIIRLCLPTFPYQDRDQYSELSADPKRCVTEPESGSLPTLYREMVFAGIDIAKKLPLVTMLRISFRGQWESCINLMVVDCLTREEIDDPGPEIFFYEDDGSRWHGWEDGNLTVVGVFE
ncbi:hypothetical protein MMC14_005137 [Varicellaria rhodocarpa]|nr:hypothetical protein [Varicellaria rhodocarpa]